MASTTLVSVPLGGSSWSGFFSTGNPAIARTQIDSNVYLNLAGQTNPAHAFAWINTVDPNTQAVTNSEGFVIRSATLQPNSNFVYTHLFKTADDTVLAFVPLNTANMQVLTIKYDIVSKTVMSVTPTLFNLSGNYSLINHTSVLQISNTKFLIGAATDSSGNGTAWIGVDYTAANNTFTVNYYNPAATNTYNSEANGWDGIWLPLTNQPYLMWQPSRSTGGSAIMILINTTSGTFTATSAASSSYWGSSNSSYASYKTLYGSALTPVGFQLDGKYVIHGKLNTPGYAATGVQNAASVGTFENVNSALIAHRNCYAIDDNHFVISYVELASTITTATPSGRAETKVPSKMHFRFFERVNNDVWTVTDRSKAAGGYVITLPSTINGLTNPFHGMSNMGYPGLKLENDFSWTFNFRYDNRFTTFNVG